MWSHGYLKVEETTQRVSQGDVTMEEAREMAACKVLHALLLVLRSGEPCARTRQRPLVAMNNPQPTARKKMETSGQPDGTN